jgi:uncharacterized Ntn-hydrolase superfamily protein
MTFSIAARCPRSGALGVAVSSKALASGAVVPHLRAGVGAIASQAFGNQFLGIDGLTLLEQGLTAERALERVIEGDIGHELRQLAIVDGEGRTSSHTGTKCIPWAGAQSGAGYVCLGNILVGDEVVEAMSRAFEASIDEELPERLMRTLEAGQDAGGDRRGRQSAGIAVVDREDYRWYDLRVDDHSDPVPELRRIFELKQADRRMWGDFRASRETPFPPDFMERWDTIVAGIEASISGKATERV